MTEFTLPIRIERMTHSGGLRILHVKKPLSTAWAALKVGFGSVDRRFSSSWYDYELPSGVAHFLEHKLFDQPDGSDVTERFAELSADVNAYTTENETVYLFSCTDCFEKSLETLLKFVTTPYFTRKSMAKERPIIAEEIRMYKDSPDSALTALLLRGMYKNHPIREDIAGKISDLRKITPEMLYLVCQIFYNPHNMALCVCGDVDMDRILAVCDRVLSTSDCLPDFYRYRIDEPAGVYRKRISGHMDITKPKCAIGVKDDPLPAGEAGMRRKVADRLLCEILFGRSSSLSTSLYEEGVILSPLYADLMQSERFSLLEISADCPDPARFFRRMSEALAQIGREGIREADFLRCRKAFCGNLLMGCDDPEAICDLLVDHAFEDYDPHDELRCLLKLEKSELESEFSRLFRDERMTFCTLLPHDKGKNVSK